MYDLNNFTFASTFSYLRLSQYEALNPILLIFLLHTPKELQNFYSAGVLFSGWLAVTIKKYE